MYYRQGLTLSIASFVANRNLIWQDQADELVKMADVNGDGSIDYSEFVQLYNFKSAMINWYWQRHKYNTFTFI